MKNGNRSGAAATTRRVFLKRGVAAGLTTGLLSQSLLGQDKFSTTIPQRKLRKVAFFTDVHAREEPEVQKALIEAADAIAESKPDVIIGGGDYIHGGIAGSFEQGQRRWTVFETFLTRLKQKLPGVPIHLMLGNHDLVGASPEDGSEPVKDPKAMFRKAVQRDKTYHAFNVGGYRVFLLDSIVFHGNGNSKYKGSISKEQISWLKEELAKLGKSSPVIVASHIPFHTAFYQIINGPHSALAPNLAVENAKMILEMFSAQDFRLLLQGHLHFDESIRVNQRTMLMGGAVCGAWWKGAQLDTPPGFSLLTLHPNHIENEYRSFGWNSPILP